jgi:hypothetical protein
MFEPDPVFGRGDRSEWREYQVKGNLLAARPRYIRDRWGNSGFEDVTRRLDPTVRDIFATEILPFAWYPFPTMAAVDRAIVEGPMGNDVSRMKDFGSTIARYDLPTLYKVLFKFGSPSFILRRIAVVYRTYVRGGSISPADVGDGHAVVSLETGALPSYFCSHGVPGWFTAAVELSGGKAVEVREVHCVHRDAKRCSWELNWRR